MGQLVKWLRAWCPAFFRGDMSTKMCVMGNEPCFIQSFISFPQHNTTGKCN